MDFVIFDGAKEPAKGLLGNDVFDSFMFVLGKYDDLIQLGHLRRTQRALV